MAAWHMEKRCRILEIIFDVGAKHFQGFTQFMINDCVSAVEGFLFKGSLKFSQYAHISPLPQLPVIPKKRNLPGNKFKHIAKILNPMVDLNIYFDGGWVKNESVSLNTVLNCMDLTADYINFSGSH
ncbi:MAG: hypothetical protein H0W50_02530 [Parachlamydiaceae bacterium]|nr:hypothetical protein [Parachlamydiaceae bacterium]